MPIESTSSTETPIAAPNSPSESASPQDSPTPNPAAKSPTEAGLEPSPSEPSTIDPETAKNERVARALASAAKKERKAAERERQALERAKQAESARDELNSLLSEASKNPDKALKLLEKAGIPNLDSLARLILQLEPEKKSPNDIASQALKEAQELKEQIEKEKREVREARERATFEQAYKEHISKVSELLEKSGDEYELVRDADGAREVLDRCYGFIRENQITEMTEEEEGLLIKHFADEYEKELQPKALNLLTRLTKLKKLSISTHNNSGEKPSAPTQEAKSEPVDSELSKAVSSVMREKKSSKFITNEKTITSTPTPRINKTSRRDDDLIKQTLEAMNIK